MAKNDHATTKYKIIADSGGNPLPLFRDVSGMAVCTDQAHPCGNSGSRAEAGVEHRRQRSL